MALVDATRELRPSGKLCRVWRRRRSLTPVRVLTDVAESLAQTTEAMKTMQPAEWMTHEQAAAYLQRTPGAFKELVRTEEVPKHYLSERGILYSRTELDAWLMSR